MSSTFGDILKISLFGESHGEAIGMVIDGFPTGKVVDENKIKQALEKRKPHGLISTPRKEKDEVEFLSGVFEGKTTGAPITFIIRNNNTNSKNYEKGIIRPSHADLTSYIKYQGNNDYRGGGHFSGRLTAPIVVLGSLCMSLLEEKGIKIGSKITQIGNVKDDDFDFSKIESQIDYLNQKPFAVLNEEVEKRMVNEILDARQQSDSIGGKLQTIITGLKPGIGEPYFNSVESILSSLIFSIGGVKAVSFGDGEEFVSKKGSQVNDELIYENDEIKYLTNHNGGILGGITTGQPVIINTTIKPTPSIFKEQNSIDVEKKENIKLKLEGRHDPCIVHRARMVIDSIVAYGLVELIMRSNVWK